MNQILAQAAPNEKDQSQRLITMRKPNPEDGSVVNNLVENCKPLDTNSMYCNNLQCSHFRDTAVLAEEQGETIGFISGYLLPEQPDTLFVWQVAVSPKARGLGLDVIHEGNADSFGFLQSIVIDRGGDPEKASQVAALLGIPNWIQQISDDTYRLEQVQIIVGRDYKSLKLLE